MMNDAELCKENTRNFLISYNIQKKMSEVSGYDENDDMTTSAAPSIAEVRPFHEQLNPGQIRILKDVGRITYVLLLRRWEENSFVVTTFSHYNDPATDEEIKLDFNGGLFMNTLQMWNTRTLQDKTLKESWLCGYAPEQVVQDAWDFWSCMVTGKEIPERFKGKTGTPIETHDDPRLQYIKEESEFFEFLDEKDLKNAEVLTEEAEFEHPAWMTVDFPALWKVNDYAMAAGEKRENIFMKCSITRRSEIALVEYSYTEKTLWIELFSADYEETEALDGTKLINSDQEVIGEIFNGKCTVSELDNFDGAFALQLPNGTFCFLEEMTEE